MRLGEWDLATVDGGRFRLDGGVMFGVVPKVIWESVIRPDEKNRIAVANHCVLARRGDRCILIDTGYGDKHAPLDRSFYDMPPGSPLVESLASLGLSVANIDTVVLSHLHFDHVSGAIQRGDDGRLRLTFPNAEHVVSRCEWEEATSGVPELATAYPSADIDVLHQSESLRLIDDEEEIAPGLVGRITGGHTRGHMALLFESAGHTALYPCDLCPSSLHLRRMWHLAYDVYPLETRRQKPRLMGQAADGGWWVLWNHDPQMAVSRVERHPKREFVAVDARPNL
ncbi:MAG: MBL fold metallo-hydrolase [Planctomycetaceae bacterium]|nr:MBL fold metallo-hydrolase [Planctomycetaceae bacterium]